MSKQQMNKDADPSGLSEALRIDFVLETVERMQAHLGSFGAYTWTGDLRTAREFWACVKLCGQSISRTLDEIEKGRADG